MRFTHLAVENWRNFAEIGVELQNRAFLIGPNASGKSNFLDVFRFLHDVVESGVQKAVGIRGGVSRIRSLAAHGKTDVVIDVGLQDADRGEWRYRLGFKQDKQRRPIIMTEKVWQGRDLILSRPDDNDVDDPERLLHTNLEQVIANREFREIADFFSSVRYYHIVPQLVREPDRSAGRTDDPFGGNFLEQVAHTDKRTQQSRLKRIGEALKVAVPQLADLKLEKDERGIPHLYGKYEHWRSRGAWQTEVDFSDGTLRLMGLLWALLDGTGPILLEEPELSLHPEVVRHIPQMITRVQRKRTLRQVFLSTHSSDLLGDDGIAPDEFFLFTPVIEGTKVESGATVAEVRQLLESGLSVAEVAMARTKPPRANQLSLFGE